MRGATDIKDLKIMVDGKKGKVMSFHITEDSQVYTKIRLSDGTNVNYRLTQLDPEMKCIVDQRISEIYDLIENRD